MTGWRDRALCRCFPGLPWIEEPERRRPGSTRAMTVVCDVCPVNADCARYVDRYAITAGFWCGQDRQPGAHASGGAA